MHIRQALLPTRGIGTQPCIGVMNYANQASITARKGYCTTREGCKSLTEERAMKEYERAEKPKRQSTLVRVIEQ